MNWLRRSEHEMDKDQEDELRQHKMRPPGYELLLPSEKEVWKEGDLWLSSDGSWEVVKEFVGRRIGGIGARMIKKHDEKT